MWTPAQRKGLYSLLTLIEMGTFAYGFRFIKRRRPIMLEGVVPEELVNTDLCQRMGAALDIRFSLKLSHTDLSVPGSADQAKDASFGTGWQIESETVQALESRLKAYDQRNLIIRLLLRLFTKIEKSRSLLFYLKARTYLAELMDVLEESAETEADEQATESRFDA